MRTTVKICVLLLLAGAFGLPPALGVETTYRLFDGITLFVDNPAGKDFTVDLEVRDINHRMHGPSELLVKAYPPDGKPVVRQIIADDGVVAPTSGSHGAGWDHEAWYYAAAYSRGLRPLTRWSSFSDPARLAAASARSFSYPIKGGQKGVYRVLLAGSPDHYVTVRLDVDLKYGVAGSPEWLHGHGQLYRRSYIYVPRTTETVNVLFLQYDEPAKRSFSLTDAKGNVLASGHGGAGLVQAAVPANGELDEQVLTLEVSDGPGDFIVNVTHQIGGEFSPVRAKTQGVTAALAPDAATARALQGGAIYHDNALFWQMHQVRLHDWLKKLPADAFEYAADLPQRQGFISVGSHNSPKAGSADRIMHSWALHKDPKALNAALRDMLFGMRLIGHGDHVAIGPKRNLAYEMGCYTYFWWRPAWRIIQQSNAPTEVKEILKEFVVQGADRLAFCRTISTGNGNAFGSLMEALRYCYEATGDALQKETFETVWERFTTGGYCHRVGIGPSGGLQESMGYDYHYGSYVLRGWRAVMADLKDERFIKAHERMLNLYSYLWMPSPSGAPYCSRTSIQKTCGGAYDAWDKRFRWKGFSGGRSFLVGVNDHNEWYAAKRQGYYMLTYHGRLTPTWEGEGFHGQIGLGGGGICQLVVPGKGQVIGGKPNGSYGAGMHLSQWRNFHIHGLVGTTTDGKPLVAANSEHFNARLEDNTVTSSGKVRQSSVEATRTYTYGPYAIDCEVALAESGHDNVFGLWGGRPALRGKVAEAYEMIPFVDAPKPKKKPRHPTRGRTTVVALAADNSPMAALSETAQQAAGVLIDRGGYGVVIELDKPRAVSRGQNDTVLVQVVGKKTAASEVALRYRLLPFQGDPPKLGGAGSAAKAHPLTKLGKIEAVDQVKAALAELEPVEIKNDKFVLATIRFAVAGMDFAVFAKVNDRKMAYSPTIWKGSCLEVFGSMPGTFDIGQVFLAPQVGDQAAGAYRPNGTKQRPAPAIAVASAVVEGGYELSALVPLADLKLDAAKEKFLLEFQANAVGSGKRRAYKTLFGSERAYENNSAYGLFAPPTPDEE